MLENALHTFIIFANTRCETDARVWDGVDICKILVSSATFHIYSTTVVSQETVDKSGSHYFLNIFKQFHQQFRSAEGACAKISLLLDRWKFGPSTKLMRISNANLINCSSSILIAYLLVKTNSATPPLAAQLGFLDVREYFWRVLQTNR